MNKAGCSKTTSEGNISMVVGDYANYCITMNQKEEYNNLRI